MGICTILAANGGGDTECWVARLHQDFRVCWQFIAPHRTADGYLEIYIGDQDQGERSELHDRPHRLGRHRHVAALTGASMTRHRHILRVEALFLKKGHDTARVTELPFFQRLGTICLASEPARVAKNPPTFGHRDRTAPTQHIETTQDTPRHP